MTLEEFVHTENLRWWDHQRGNILSIDLYDTHESIFSQLVFSDENDNIYKDDEYKNAHREHYLKDIQEDLYWYGQIYDEMGIHDYIIVDNKPQKEVAEQIISQFNLLVHDWNGVFHTLQVKIKKKVDILVSLW